MYTLTETRINFYGTDIIVYGMRSENLRFDKISSHKNDVLRLIKIFNQMDVAECHFKDILDEYLDDPEEFIGRFIKL